MKNANLILAWVVSCLCWYACSDPVAPSLSKADEQLIDSLYLSAAKDYNSQYDSICDSHQNQIWQSTVDSIEQVRLKEIANMLER